jgi:hypothetical protein
MRWLLPFLLLPSGAWAADLSPPLTVGTVRALMAASGINPGTIFPAAGGRYALVGVTISGRGNEWVARIRIKPLEKK